jgi:hypothetical protein
MSVEFCCYHDGQFWVGVLSLRHGQDVRAARVVFGAEPSDAELMVFLQQRGYELLARAERAPAVRAGVAEVGRINPKRAARRAATLAREPRPSTAAQDAVRMAQEADKALRKQSTRDRRDRRAEEQWRARQVRVKAKRRGR